MGLDAEIWFELDINKWDNQMRIKVQPVDALWLGGLLKPREPYTFYDVDYSEHLGRYFSENYCRGFWPAYAAILLELLQVPEVGRVWYFGDSQDAPFEGKDLVTLERLNALNKTWVACGRSWYD